jgi:hypothetical protein
MPVNRINSSRMAQQYRPGVGQHFTTPKKSRRGSRYNEPVRTLAQNKKLLTMEAELRHALGIIDGEPDEHNISEDRTLNEDVSTGVQPLPLGTLVRPLEPESAGEEVEEAWVDIPMNIPDAQEVDSQPPHQEDVIHHHDIQQWISQQSKYKRGIRDKPSPTAENLYQRWLQLLPQLVNPLLEYESRVVGHPAPTERDIDWSPSQCRDTQYCQNLVYVVMCLFWDRKSIFDIQ